MIISIVGAVAIFAIIVIVHEAGHFTVAKRMGVRVLRFSVGYPPRVWGFRRGRTDYAIGATPLGGYVRMLGDEIASDEPAAETLRGYLEEVKLDLVGAARSHRSIAEGDDDRVLVQLADEAEQAEVAAAQRAASGAIVSASAGELMAIGRPPTTTERLLLRAVARYRDPKLAIEHLVEDHPGALLEEFKQQAFPSQPLRRRFAIVLAGPAANILFAPLLMMITLMVGMPIALAVIGTVDRGLPGYTAGLRSGDHVLAINDNPVDSWDDFSRMVKASNGQPLRLRVERTTGNRAQILNLVVQPKLVVIPTIYGDKEPTWIIGVGQSGAEGIERLPPWRAITQGLVETARMGATLTTGIAKIVEGATPVREALGGPIMIARIAGREVHRGFANVALFMMMISLELGIINLLPIPMLDGGHVLFFAIEAVKGSPLKLRHREIAMQVGLFILAVLMAFVIFNDLSHLVG
ncbi:MAG TPA: site-2 protease family protein [Candidatus Binataceae bacterium]|nr:site-2 protease family protein [Candidatus Binataceae bacterium]